LLASIPDIIVVLIVITDSPFLWQFPPF